jgi:hypothetical protein
MIGQTTMNYRCLISQLSLIAGIIIMSGCSSFKAATGGILGTRQNFTVAPELQENPPMVVAILPFVGRVESADACETVRRNFYGSFSALNYKDIELSSVDAALSRAGIGPTDIDTVNPARLGSILGADAIVYGEVTQFSRLFLLAYSNVTVGLSAKMVRTCDGRLLWTSRKTFRSHAGGPAISPEALVSNSFWAGLKLRDVERTRAAGNATREIVKSIPNPDLHCFASRQKSDLQGTAAEGRLLMAQADMLPDKRVELAGEEEPPPASPGSDPGHEKLIAETTGAGADPPIETANSADESHKSRAVVAGRQDLEDIQKTIEQQPDNDRAYCSLGFIYYREGNMDRAIEAISKATDIEPAHAGYHYNLGLAYMEQGMTDAAQKQLRMIPAEDRLWRNAQALLRYANAQSIRGQ